MIGRYGPPVFQILKGKSGAYNVALMKCIPNNNVLINDWLYYFLKSAPVQNKIISLSQRARQSGVRPEDLNELLIPLPSIEKQKFHCEELNKEIKIVNDNNELIIKMQNRITEKLNSFWSN